MLAPVFLAAHVVLWHAYRGAEQRALEASVAAYNAAHAESRVEAVAFPNDGFSSKLEAAIPLGNGPDLFIQSHEGVGSWSAGGLIAALPEPDTATLAQYLPGTVEPLRSGGRLYGLPLAFKSIALYYRTDLVAAPPATTDELIALCRRLGDPDHGRYGLVYEAGSFYHHAAWLHGYGGEILDANHRPQLDSAASIAAARFVRGLADQRLIPEESTGVLATQLFNDGRAAMTLSGPWLLGELKDGVPFAVTPLPAVSATGRPAAPLLTVEAVFPAARAHAPVEALAFARWLSGPEGAARRAFDGRQAVATRVTWDDPRLGGDRVLAAFRRQLDATVPMSNALEMRTVWEPAQWALRAILRGGAEPEPAMREAERRILALLKPPPAAVDARPYALLGGVVLLLAVAWSVRRVRARGGLAALRAGAVAYACLLPAASGMLVLVLVPFAVGAAMSLYDYSSGVWTFIGLSNFLEVLNPRQAVTSLSFYTTLGVTILWTVANVSLHLTIGVLLALLLRDPLLKLRGVYRMLLIVPWAVPNYITALIWRGMFHRQFGAINGLLVALGAAPISWFSRFTTAFAANLATNVWLGFPFMMVVTLGALSRIPRELEEAAALDGANGLARFRHVVIPLLKPALLPSVLLGMVWTFNMFNVVFLVSGGEPDGSTDILVSQAYRWAFTRGHRYGYAAAYAVLIFAVLALQTSLARRAGEADA